MFNDELTLETNGVKTAFAPAARATDSALALDRRIFAEDREAQILLNAVPDIFMILNHERQIVFANRSLAELLQYPEGDSLIGQRPGEALRCSHAHESAGGCGTTEACRVCGAVRAILGSQQGRVAIEECHIAQESGDALDLRVRATPITLEERKFTLFAVQDISHEKRRKALERIFFHDLLNTAGGVMGLADILHDADPSELDDLADDVYALTKQLVGEIKAQQILAAAESGDLQPHPVEVDTLEVIESVRLLYHNHEVATGRTLVLDPACVEAQFTTDPTLLQRVLSNMVKNAIEASQLGQTVTIGCALRDGGVEFSVHNATTMPRATQLQVFQRSFSSKGTGRGLGTYSMKLLTERYLHGRIAFTSTPEAGTTFTAWFPLTFVPSDER